MCGGKLGHYNYGYCIKHESHKSIIIYVCLDCLHKAAGSIIVVWGLGTDPNEYDCHPEKIRYFNDWHIIGSSERSLFVICWECMKKAIEGTALWTKIQQKLKNM